MKYFVFFTLMLATSYMRAETIEGKPSSKAEKVVDEVKMAVPTIIEDLFKPVLHPWSAQLIMELPTYSFYVGAPSVKGVAYLPNVAPQAGVKILYKGIGTMLAASLPIPKDERDRRGDSQKTNIVLNSYWRQNAIDIYYQKFRGFYVSSFSDELSSNRPNRYPQLPGAHVQNYGFNWYHARDPSRYSLKAAFNQTEFQIRSGGSYLYTPFYNYLEINLGNVLVLGSDPDSLKAIPKLDAGRFHTLGWGMGYGYSYIRERFFAGALVSLSPAVQMQHIERQNSKTIDSLSLAAKGNLNLATGWNYDEYVFGIKILIDSLYGRVSGTELWSTLLVGQAFFGARF